MRLVLKLAMLCLVLPTGALAQFTTVTGTVIDPNGLPYAGGTISAALVSSGSPTLNGLAYTPPSSPSGLNIAGSFTMRLADVTVLLPGSSTWSFTVCSGIGTVQPSFGKASQCFTVTGVSISGASQDIGATLRAAALALTATFSSTGITCSATCTTNFIPVFTGAATVANSPITATTNQIQMPGAANALTPSANGSAVVSFQKPSGTCAGSNVVPAPTIGCFGMDTQLLPTNAVSVGTIAAFRALASNTQGSATTLQLGIFAQAQAAQTTTEERALYAEAYDNTNITTTTRRGIFAFAGNATGNTTATNEPIVVESYAAGGSTNTNDFSVHVVPPAGGGTFTTHAGIKVDAQATGVELQVAPHVFSALPACSSTYEGSFSAVTDATSATNGATVVGGGAHHILAYCNSVNWLVVVGT